MLVYLSTVRNIPRFRDSCDVMELLFTAFEALRHISKAFHEAYTIFLRLLRIGSHNGSTFLRGIVYFRFVYVRPSCAFDPKKHHFSFFFCQILKGGGGV